MPRTASRYFALSLRDVERRERYFRHRLAEERAERTPAVAFRDPEPQEVARPVGEIARDVLVKPPIALAELAFVVLDRLVQRHLREDALDGTIPRQALPEHRRRLRVNPPGAGRVERRVGRRPLFQPLEVALPVRRGGLDPVVLFALGEHEPRSGIQEVQILVGHRHRLVGRRLQGLMQQRVDGGVVDRAIPENLERAIQAGRPGAGQTDAPDGVFRRGFHVASQLLFVITAPVRSRTVAAPA
jgi:hypothetical protein